MNIVEQGKQKTLDILDFVIADLQSTAQDVEWQAVMFARKCLESSRPFLFAVAMGEIGYKLQDPIRLGNPQVMAEQRKQYGALSNEILSTLDSVVANLQMGSASGQAVIMARECMEIGYWNDPNYFEGAVMTEEQLLR